MRVGEPYAGKGNAESAAAAAEAGFELGAGVNVGKSFVCSVGSQNSIPESGPWDHLRRDQIFVRRDFTVE